MLGIAQKKKAENIAEFVLYMWQMEDLLRGLEFNISELETQVLSSIENEEMRQTNALWFKNLAQDMSEESVTVSGHQHDSAEVISAMAFLQNKLLSTGSNEAFLKAYKTAKPVLEDFRNKSEKIPMNEVEIAFTALYGMLTLRISGKEISPETQDGIQSIGMYLAQLSKAYHSENK